MSGTLSLKNISTKQSRIAKLAKEVHDKPLTTLAHHLDVEWLKESYRRTRKTGSVGVDGQTAMEYAENLERNLESLLNRAKSGDRYRAPPVRRVYLPKEDGTRRPIGVPTFEDKVLQRAVVMLLEPIYEQEFRDCSYGFRPGKSAHQALEKLWKSLMDFGGGWVLELDIESFFDSMDKKRLRDFLSQRVNDGVVVRLIGKWLKAGVLEEGCVYHPETGTPQGGVISPLLANLYLHEVLDVWFEDTVKPRLDGRAELVRYADDATLVFEQKGDAERVLAVLGRRLSKYGLTLHPKKTRLVAFRRPPSCGRGTGGPRPGTFDVLGFTHYWGRSQKGGWVVKRRTAKSRIGRALRSISRWMKAHRHDPVREQHKTLQAKLRGHYGYYGITGNTPALSRFRYEVTRRWRYWLGRRNTRRLIWEKFRRLHERLPLPPVVVVHSMSRSANP